MRALDGEGELTVCGISGLLAGWIDRETNSLMELLRSTNFLHSRILIVEFPRNIFIIS